MRFLILPRMKILLDISTSRAIGKVESKLGQFYCSLDSRQSHAPRLGIQMNKSIRLGI